MGFFLWWLLLSPLRCSAARGILPDQGSNPCVPHWQADSLPLSHQGSPSNVFSLSTDTIMWFFFSSLLIWWVHLSISFKNIYVLFLAVLGLCCCAGFSLVAESGGYSLAAVQGLLPAVTSLVAECGLQACGLQCLWLPGSRVWAQQLWHMGLVAPQHVGSSWIRDWSYVPWTQVGSSSLDNQGSPH